MTELQTCRLSTFLSPESRKGSGWEQRALPSVVCILVLFCAATVIAAPAQSVSFTTLVNFNGTDGAAPYGGLVQGADGNLYGTTAWGGAYGFGTIFRIRPEPPFALTTLYSFCAQTGCPDGSGPWAGLVQATDGNLYGITNGGGAYDSGTVFRISRSGALTTLYSFCASGPPCADGSWSFSPPVQASDGNFYGTTYVGGNFNIDCDAPEGEGCGTVFKITPAGALTTLYKFCSQPNCPDGVWPWGGLVQGRDGNFYGTTTQGGVNEYYGTVFKITPTGALTTLHSFDNWDGESPSGVLLQVADANFYGTTQAGGPGGYGTVFSITAAGTLTTLYGFGGFYGEQPWARLVQASDGNFYGTTIFGGYLGCDSFGCGTVFKITPSGTLTTLHRFSGPPIDGAHPASALVQASDGFFYGTTIHGGTHGDGTVYRVGVVHSCASCRP